MQKVMPATAQEAKSYFSDELRTVMSRRRVVAQDASFEYLVNLLFTYMESKNFFRMTEEGKIEDNVLAQLYAEYLQEGGEARAQKLKRLGDISLLVTGLFPDSLKRKLVDLNYYFGMGGTAYGMLSDLQFSSLMRSVYGELSEKFKEFSNAIGEISERSGMQKDSDVLALYERWLLTGDDRLVTRLQEHGIVPVAAAFKKSQ